jgi:hypothetical protein
MYGMKAYREREIDREREEFMCVSKEDSSLRHFLMKPLKPNVQDLTQWNAYNR